ncbi:MBL fold metallo-hydrolase [Ichthyenterobacterium sp. W332]|uniref:MBL fold metallo-hydrolase n=1 Tax=Microcosmobacter mediterraneus TaxID=3075607 RepID=A0ABU2YHU2_9FLAO|nr:MBL fold metallo-hydrolase [Ichthyenterobacterium sp. W332]MDT0557716.1 MBL fold metallo-hydrolase [Ichthyenterobacterium sp. W332]
MKFLTTLFTITCINFSTFISAQGMNDVEIKSTKLTERIYVLEGAGGQIGVSVGEDGVFIIDDQFSPLSNKIITKLKELSDKPISIVVNTHFHGDHTGGNENMGKLGATIIAHENVRERLENTPKRDGTKNSKEALPVITYNDKMSIYINGEQVAIYHSKNAHTDGDSLLYFTESNVLHTGDTYFSGWYPYIDLKSGGSVNGYIDTVKRSLILIDDDTIIIPGHGPISNKKEYSAYLVMLETLKERILTKIKAGLSEDEIVNDSTLTSDFDDQGFSWRFITSEKIRRTFYQSLKGTL